jgi:hypothetical protein
MSNILAACWILLTGVATGGAGRHGRPHPITVGWNDELNALATWQPREGGMKADVFAERRGAMTLRLPHAPDGFPHAYQWGGVAGEASVDLGRYPVLVAHVLNVKPGSYTHLDLEQRDYAGKPTHVTVTPALQYPGVIVFDVGEKWGTDVRRLYLRINVGGSLSGAQAEYAWVRFVRREDVARLRENPGWQAVDLKP